MSNFKYDDIIPTGGIYICSLVSQTATYNVVVKPRILGETINTCLKGQVITRDHCFWETRYSWKQNQLLLKTSNADGPLCGFTTLFLGRIGIAGAQSQPNPVLRGGQTTQPCELSLLSVYGPLAPKEALWVSQTHNPSGWGVIIYHNSLTGVVKRQISNMRGELGPTLQLTSLMKGVQGN